ncbi:hypothetical protein [Sorangium sp. So ce887]|uniref:hypothetical protein n=1 Tax=Sorangium sp. So ce887 TaxID=3133324 RepID=UPI003F611198
MKLRLSSFIAAAIVAILSPLPGCTETPDDTGGGGTGGAGGSDSGSTSASGSTSSGGGAGGSGGAGSTSASTGGGGSTGSGSEIEPTFETVKFVAQSACFGAGCHNDDMNPLDLMINEELHTRLTSHISKNCGPLVNLDNPQESAIIKVLQGPCGATPRMPLECVNEGDTACIPPDYIEAITQWIADGALE